MGGMTFRVPVRGATCRGPASAGSRGYPQDERRQREREREKTRETSLDRAKSAREREREGEREREREENEQTGVFAVSGRVWQCFVLHRGFYALN